MGELQLKKDLRPVFTDKVRATLRENSLRDTLQRTSISLAKWILLMLDDNPDGAIERESSYWTPKEEQWEENILNKRSISVQPPA
jgi:hypothetical protein